jgi:transposase-like protein
MHNEDILELRKEFQKVDIKDQESVQKWFADHPYIDKSDLAIIAQRSLIWVNKLYKLAGYKPKKIKPSILYKPHAPVLPEAPENWKDREWLQDALKKYSLNSIGKAVGVHHTTVRSTAIKLGLDKPTFRESTKSRNPCCTKAWCYEYYVVKKYSMEKCAKLAGIARPTFAKWLMRFEIPTRYVKATHVETPKMIWINKLVHNLEQQEVVRKIKYYEDRIHVRFKNFFWETYFFIHPNKNIPRSYNITKENSKLENVPKIQFEFETDINKPNKYPAHIILPRREFDSHSLLEQRIAIHNLAWAITRRGWVPMDYPNYILEKDKNRFNISRNRFLVDNNYQMIDKNGKEAAGWKIAEHFLPFKEVESLFKSPRYVIKALSKLAQSPKSKLNTHNILRHLCQDVDIKSVPRIKTIDPRMYILMLSKFGINGKVMDLYPGHGARMMACANLGLTYVAPRTRRMEFAVQKGIIDFLRLRFEWFDGQNVEFTFHDHDLEERSIENILKYSNISKNILHFVHKKNKKNILNSFTPKSLIPVQSFHRSTPDYFFLF